MQEEHQDIANMQGGVIADSIGFWMLTAFVLFGPFLFIPSFAAPFQFTKTLIIGVTVLIALICFVVARLREQQISIPIHPLFFAVWLIPAAYMLSALFSGGGPTFFGNHVDVDTPGFIVLCALLMTLTVLLMRTQERILTTYLTFLISAGVLGFFIILRLIFGSDILSFGGLFPTNAASPLGTLYDTGIFFGLIAILSLVSLAVLRSHTWIKTILFAELVLGVLFLTLVNIPIIWGLVAFCALGVFVHSLLPGKKFSKNTSIDGSSTLRNKRSMFSFSALFVLAVMLALIGSGGSITQLLANTLNISHVEVRPSWQTTVAIANNVYATHALFGSGPGTFFQDWALYRPRELNNSVFWNLDFQAGIGFIPTSFVTTGLVGVLAWILFFALFILAGLRAFLSRGNEAEFPFFLSLSSFLGALYLWMIAFIQTPTGILIALAFFVTGIFIASLRFRISSIREYEIAFSDNPSLGFIVALVLTVCFLGSLSGLFTLTQRYAAAWIYQKSMIALQRDGNVNEAEVGINKALVLFSSDEYLRLASQIGVRRLNDLFADTSISNEEKQKRFQSILTVAVTRAQSAREIDSKNYQNWLALGLVYQTIVPLQIEGAYESAKKSYEQAMILRPDSPEIALAYAYLERAHGNNEAAEKNIGTALALRPAYTEAMFLLAQIQIQKGDLEKAIQSVQATTLLDPSNPVAFFQLGLLNYSMGKYAPAKVAFESALKVNADYANARYFLGLTDWRLGDAQAAIAEITTVQKTNPDNTEVQAVLANLHAGRSPFTSLNETDQILERKRIPIDGE